MAAVSRRRIAVAISQKLVNGEDKQAVLNELAAYLIKHRLTSQANLYIADIEHELARGGCTIADVTTAHELDDSMREAIKKAVGDSGISLREHIDTSIIGGIIVKLHNKEMDRSLTSRLRRLRAS